MVILLPDGILHPHGLKVVDTSAVDSCDKDLSTHVFSLFRMDEVEYVGVIASLYASRF